MSFQFFPERVKIVDQVGNNILVRGPMPLTGDQTPVFAYYDVGQAAGLDLDLRSFMDISLIDCTGEQPWLAPEMAAFQLKAPPPSYWPPYLQPGYTPSVGTITDLKTQGFERVADFFWWPIEGFAEGEDPKTYLTSPGWDFGGLIARIHELMKDSEPKVVYFHCMLGADRTGAVHGGYLLKKGMPLAQVLEEVSKTPAGKPNPDYIRLLTSYAATL